MPLPFERASSARRPHRKRIHGGMGRFCRAFLASFFLMMNRFWDGCSEHEQGREQGKQQAGGEQRRAAGGGAAGDAIARPSAAPAPLNGACQCGPAPGPSGQRAQRAAALARLQHASAEPGWALPGSDGAAAGCLGRLQRAGGGWLCLQAARRPAHAPFPLVCTRCSAHHGGNLFTTPAPSRGRGRRGRSPCTRSLGPPPCGAPCCANCARVGGSSPCPSIPASLPSHLPPARRAPADQTTPMTRCLSSSSSAAPSLRTAAPGACQ